MIPWVMVLAALIGLNALAAEAVRSKRDESSQAVLLSSLQEDAQHAGRVIDPPVFLAASEGEGWGVGLTSEFFGIERGHEGPVLGHPRGVGQGRAPPVGNC